MKNPLITSISYCIYSILLGLIFSVSICYLIATSTVKSENLSKISLKQINEFSMVKENDISRLFNQDALKFNKNVDSVVINQGIIKVNIDTTANRINIKNKQTIIKF